MAHHNTRRSSRRHGHRRQRAVVRLRVVCGRGRNPTLRLSTCSAAGEVAWIPGSRGDDLLALLAQLSLRPDVPVERHGLDPEFAAEHGH